MTMEYAMGRATKRSILPAYRLLEPKGSHWHLMGYLSMAGNYVLLMYYSVVSAWIFYYAYLMMKGTFLGLDTAQVEAIYGGMMGPRGFSYRSCSSWLSSRPSSAVWDSKKALKA